MKLTAHIPVNVDPQAVVEQPDAYAIDFPPDRVPVLDPRRNDIGYVTDVRAIGENKLEVTMEIEDEDVIAAIRADALGGTPRLSIS